MFLRDTKGGCEEGKGLRGEKTWLQSSIVLGRSGWRKVLVQLPVPLCALLQILSKFVTAPTLFGLPSLRPQKEIRQEGASWHTLTLMFCPFPMVFGLFIREGHIILIPSGSFLCISQHHTFCIKKHHILLWFTNQQDPNAHVNAFTGCMLLTQGTDNNCLYRAQHLLLITAFQP